MSKPVFSCPQVGAQAVDITALIDREVLDAVSALRGDYVDVPTLLAVQQITLMREMLTELRAIREALAPVAGAGGGSVTPEQIAVIRNSHIEHRGGCSSDGFAWPCDTVVTLDALATATEREQAYRAALGMAERETRCRPDERGPAAMMCRICDQTGPEGGPINHAPDCPFAVLAAGGTAGEGRGEG